MIKRRCFYLLPQYGIDHSLHNLILIISVLCLKSAGTYLRSFAFDMTLLSAYSMAQNT